MSPRVAPPLAAFLLLLLAGAAVAEATDVQAAVGHRAPDFTLRDPAGTPVQLSRVLKEKKAVFLNFWATWCPPCRDEMPSMERAYRDYKARGLEILAVSIDAGSEAAVAARVKAFMTDLALTFPALLDPTMEVVQAYRLRGLPTSYLIDRTGVIRAVVVGPRDWASPEFRQRLEDLLK
jgi:cytochrome c biogenesis protein CcmG/thiol:disulfide interchange protein DsbE